MSPRSRLLLVASLALAALCFGMPGFSGATYTARSTNTTSTVSAAADWTPPTVAVTNPGSPLSGSTTITATASDASGIKSVLLQYAAAGSSTWTDLCAARTTAPYSCTWLTTAVADGSYQLRATATDNADYSATSALVNVSVLNTATVLLADPGDNLRGSVPLSATLAGYGNQTITAFKIEYSLADANSWTTICSGTTATVSCTWTTGSLANSYDIRANATVSGKTYVDIAQGVTIDNVAPTGSITSPAKNTSVSGTITLASSDAADPVSGIASVAFEYAPTGTTGWVSACTALTSPYSCRFDTTKALAAVYDVRAVITDSAGNVTNSASVTGVTINNAVASVSVESPAAGAYVSGTVPVTANASTSTGVAKVSIQAKTGTAAFAEVCSVTTSPYTCSWNTGTTGVYSLQAVLTDKLGATTTSAPVTVNVDNSPLRGYDVQATNSASGTVGRLNAGDRIVLTYSNQVSLSTILAGWTGASTTVAARVVDGQSLAPAGGTTDDTFSVDGVNLGTVNLQGNFVRKRTTATIPSSTMVASTTTVNGLPATIITITLGTPSGSLSTVSTAGTMRWTPSAAAKSSGGTAVSTTPVSESGTADRDF
jgi:hypothetical protein